MANPSELNLVTPQESQDWVKALLRRLLDGEHYAEDYDRSIVGEDDRGFICAAVAGSDNMWEPFDLTKEDHRAAANESFRTGRIGFLDLEYAS